MSEGTDALAAYGYQLIAGRYVLPARRTQEWEPVAGGFMRWDPGESGPMPHRGLTQDEADALNEQRAKDGKDRLNLATHNFRDISQKDLFVWVWPDEHVARTYSVAAEQAAKGWPGTELA